MMTSTDNDLDLNDVAHVDRLLIDSICNTNVENDKHDITAGVDMEVTALGIHQQTNNRSCH